MGISGEGKASAGTKGRPPGGVCVPRGLGAGMLLGTADRAPGLIPGPPLGLLFLRPATPLA